MNLNQFSLLVSHPDSKWIIKGNLCSHVNFVLLADVLQSDQAAKTSTPNTLLVVLIKLHSLPTRMF